MDEVILLDYATNEVWVYKLPRLHMIDEEIEDWLDSMGHYLPDCEWMVGQHIYIKDERI
jgi:hypothetical protein